MSVGSTYRSAPLLLNLERDETTGEFGLASTWCNLGAWPVEEHARRRTSFRHACKSLATLVGESAKLSPGDAVLDVGVGYADQTAIWKETFGVNQVIALEPSAEHVAAAQKAQDEGRLPSADDVKIRVGSADSVSAFADTCGAGFDAIICLDCAYHFRTRAAFLRRAVPLLRPGGRFAAADLTLGPSRGRSVSFISRLIRCAAQRAVAAMCDIPSGNLQTTCGYAASLEAAGLQDVSIEPLSAGGNDRVLRPFALHVEQQRKALRGQLRGPEAVLLWVISSLFTWISRYELFTFVLVSAAKPQ